MLDAATCEALAAVLPEVRHHPLAADDARHGATWCPRLEDLLAMANALMLRQLPPTPHYGPWSSLQYARSLLDPGRYAWRYAPNTTIGGPECSTPERAVAEWLLRHAGQPTPSARA